MKTRGSRVVDEGSESGFTLIETLVGLAALGLFSLLILTGLKVGATIWSTGERRSFAINDTTAVRSLVRGLVEQSYPALIQEAGSAPRIAFHGEPDRLELSAELPNSVAAGGFHRVLLRHVTDGRFAIAWTFERSQAERVEDVGAATIDLLTDTRSIVFSYFGRQEGMDTAEWSARWVGQKSLPLLVRLGIDFVDARRQPMHIAVAPRIDVDATCVFDALTRGCRGR